MRAKILAALVALVVLLPAWALPGKDDQIVFPGKHHNSVLGVINGDYDAAAVADTVLE